MITLALQFSDSVEQEQMIRICRAYGMSQARAKEFTASVITHATQFNINPWFIFYIAIAETNLKNVIGDDGASYGYFQLHRDTLLYLRKKYKLWIPQKLEELILNVDLQVYIACFYAKLLLDRYKDYETVLERWNGSKKYVSYFKRIVEYVTAVYGGASLD